jgi:hypothetical protein
MTHALALDHLVIAAATLEQGAAWCEATLGVAPGPGGKHPLFGTHNRLLKIATPIFPDAYLEIIAIDPEAAPPTRPRWFGLDDPALQERLQAAPVFLHAVARTTLLDKDRWALIQLGHEPGEPVQASRTTEAGLLQWSILVRPDGALQCGGALPTLIQWRGRHPAQAMPDSSVSLHSLALRGLNPRFQQALRLPAVQMVAGAGPALSAVFNSPKGRVTLTSAPTTVPAPAADAPTLP